MSADKRTEFLRELLALCRKHGARITGGVGGEGAKVTFEDDLEIIWEVDVDRDVARGEWNGHAHAVVL